jgi:hypothetical protein
MSRMLSKVCLMAVGLLSLGGCDYFEIKSENKRLKAEVQSQSNTNNGLNKKISELKSERDSIVVPISSFKVNLVVAYAKQDEQAQSVELPRLSPVAQISGDGFSLDMFDPGIAPPQVDSDSEGRPIFTLTFVPKNPEKLQTIDLKMVESLTTFRFRLRPMLARLGLSLSNERPPQAVLVVNGVEMRARELASSSIEEANGWNSMSIANLTANARDRYLGYLQNAM